MASLDQPKVPAPLRAVLVTSRVLFVPHNYDDLVCAMAVCPQITGLLILDNRSSARIPRALGLTLLGARGTGFNLLANYLGRSEAHRRQAYAEVEKPIWVLSEINCRAAVELVASDRIDLLVNARTRYIYQPDILAAPRLGCINIHHGLLPEQRGTMCDLWALSEGQPAGFTIHQMVEQIDAGGILRRVEIDGGEERDYPSYLRRSAQREAVELAAVLAEIERDNALQTTPNVPKGPVTHRRNPSLGQLRAMMKAGMRL